MENYQNELKLLLWNNFWKLYHARSRVASDVLFSFRMQESLSSPKKLFFWREHTIFVIATQSRPRIIVRDDITCKRRRHMEGRTRIISGIQISGDRNCERRQEMNLHRESHSRSTPEIAGRMFRALRMIVFEFLFNPKLPNKRKIEYRSMTIDRFETERNRQRCTRPNPLSHLDYDLMIISPFLVFAARKAA